MREDLLTELAYIRTRDPDHAILMLGEDLSVTMDELIVSRDSAFADTFDIIEADSEAPVEPNSEEEETTDTAVDSTALDLRVISSDSSSTAPDTASQTADPMVPEVDEETGDSAAAQGPETTLTGPETDSTGAGYDTPPSLPDSSDIQEETPGSDSAGPAADVTAEDSIPSQDSLTTSSTELPSGDSGAPGSSGPPEESSGTTDETDPVETPPEDQTAPQPEGP